MYVYQTNNIFPDSAYETLQFPVLPIVPMRFLGPGFVPSPGYGDSRWVENSPRSVPSDRHVRVEQLTVNIQAGEHGKHHAQQ